MFVYVTPSAVLEQSHIPSVGVVHADCLFAAAVHRMFIVHVIKYTGTPTGPLLQELGRAIPAGIKLLTGHLGLSAPISFAPPPPLLLPPSPPPPSPPPTHSPVNEVRKPEHRNVEPEPYQLNDGVPFGRYDDVPYAFCLSQTAAWLCFN